MTDSARFSWTVLLPVKVLARAKSRLAVLAGDRRRDLALALASDTVTAVLACPAVARVVVVTSDPVAGPLLAALGAIVVADEPADLADRLGPLDMAPSLGDSGDLGVQDLLNAALRHGAAVAARRWPGTGLAALTADLPAMSPAELAAALGAVGTAPGGAAFMPDAAGVGTTLYAVPPGGEFLPLFGGASRARHAAAGAAELSLAGTTGLRRDVDTPDDLREALALGVGPFTKAVAADLFTDV
ncbi:MAG TPA: 2-phospho-L-lactate guanylyltransferase [Trebonia sp.]|nr:2-phospho-L-lactate guanylyltransferase [Trebonia sp.]